jgi:hypothetical protein
VCGGYPDAVARLCQVLGDHVQADFCDLNCGCPIDIICSRQARAWPVLWCLCVCWCLWVCMCVWVCGCGCVCVCMSMCGFACLLRVRFVPVQLYLPALPPPPFSPPSRPLSPLPLGTHRRCARQAGSALLTKPRRFEEVVRAACGVLDVPLIVKTRCAVPSLRLPGGWGHEKPPGDWG